MKRQRHTGIKKYITKCIPSVNVHIFRVISLEHFTITFRKNRKILGEASDGEREKPDKVGRRVN